METVISLDPQQAAHERLQRARGAFDAVNRTLPQGMPPFEVPPIVETAAGVNALTTVLIEAGVLNEAQFLAAKCNQMAELIEGLTAQAREIKRQAMGLVIAGPGQAI